MRVFIPEDMVIDGYLSEPLGGKILTGLGVKLVSVRENQTRQIELSGLVQWSRICRVDRLMETEMDVDGIRLLTQEYSFDGAAAEVGTTRTVSGVPIGVRDYEFEDFEIPDVRREWTVDAAARWESFFMVDLHPVEFRFQATSGNPSKVVLQLWSSQKRNNSEVSCVRLYQAEQTSTSRLLLLERRSGDQFFVRARIRQDR